MSSERDLREICEHLLEMERGRPYSSRLGGYDPFGSALDELQEYLIRGVSPSLEARRETMWHKFLVDCHSKPLTIGDLNPGDVFIMFPDDGDDSGHGGFKGGGRLLVKIVPYHPGKGYHESFLLTCKPYVGGDDMQWPLTYPVIKVHMY